MNPLARDKQQLATRMWSPLGVQEAWRSTVQLAEVSVTRVPRCYGWVINAELRDIQENRGAPVMVDPKQAG
jgi:hypothetical protein